MRKNKIDNILKPSKEFTKNMNANGKIIFCQFYQS